MLLTPHLSLEANFLKCVVFVPLLDSRASLINKVPPVSTHVSRIYSNALNKVTRRTEKKYKTNSNVRDIKTVLQTFGCS